MMNRSLTIFAFCFLVFAFSSTPARAVGICPGPIEEDPAGECCNWGDKNTNPAHIRVGDPGCNEDTGWICSKHTIDGSQKPFGPCQYCSNTVCKYGPGCEQTCNNACCPASPPDDGEEETCHMDDTNLTTCCPVDAPSPPSNFLEWLAQQIGNITLPFSLKVENFKASDKFIEATDYYFGKLKKKESDQNNSNTSASFNVLAANSDEELELEEGVFFRLAPPNLLQERFPNEGDEVRKRKEDAKWSVELDDVSGEEGDDALNDGDMEHNKPYFEAAKDLRNFLVAIPKTENGTSYRRMPKETLAASPLINPNPNNNPNPEVLGSADLCPPVWEYDTHKTCTPEDAKGTEMTIGRFLSLITGGLKLFPKIADLDYVHFITGIDTDEEGDAFQDPHYDNGGFAQIFQTPTEATEEPYKDLTAKGKATLKLTIGPIGPFHLTFDLGQQDLQLRHEGSNTEALEGENRIWDKLTPPEAENGTTTYRAPTAPTTPSTVLASTQNSINTRAPLDPLPPLNQSFAEKLGRTLGTWLGKLITL